MPDGWDGGFWAGLQASFQVRWSGWQHGVQQGLLRSTAGSWLLQEGVKLRGEQGHRLQATSPKMWHYILPGAVNWCWHPGGQWALAVSSLQQVGCQVLQLRIGSDGNHSLASPHPPAARSTPGCRGGHKQQVGVLRELALCHCHCADGVGSARCASVQAR
jgi:hypothetical protein